MKSKKKVFKVWANKRIDNVMQIIYGYLRVYDFITNKKFIVADKPYTITITEGHKRSIK